VSRLTGPRALKKALKDTDGGPSVSIDGGEWVLYEWSAGSIRTTELVRDRDWNSFLTKVEKWAAEHGE
jgi:hypothetical protein